MHISSLQGLILHLLNLQALTSKHLHHSLNIFPTHFEHQLLPLCSFELILTGGMLNLSQSIRNEFKHSIIMDKFIRWKRWDQMLDQECSELLVGFTAQFVQEIVDQVIAADCCIHYIGFITI